MEEATRPHLPGYEWMEGLPEYGLLWWVAREDHTEGWYATGYGGQYLAVFPELELVAVMTGKVENPIPITATSSRGRCGRRSSDRRCRACETLP